MLCIFCLLNGDAHYVVACMRLLPLTSTRVHRRCCSLGQWTGLQSAAEHRATQLTPVHVRMSAHHSVWIRCACTPARYQVRGGAPRGAHSGGVYATLRTVAKNRAVAPARQHTMEECTNPEARRIPRKRRWRRTRMGMGRSEAAGCTTTPASQARRPETPLEQDRQRHLDPTMLHPQLPTSTSNYSN